MENIDKIKRMLLERHHLELLEQVGREGGCGVVYRAKSVEPGVLHGAASFRAVKISHATIFEPADFVVSPSGSATRVFHGSPAEREHAKRELDALSRVVDTHRHGNILVLFGAFNVLGRLVTVWELADCSLAEKTAEYQRQRSRGIPQVDLLRFLSDAARAIDFLHQDHTYHYDIKPENLLLIRETVKLADFGLAKFYGATGITSIGSIGGSLGYYPPSDPGETSDLYALAATYVELLTGRHPFGLIKNDPPANHAIDVIGRQLAWKLDLPAPMTNEERELVRIALAPKVQNRWKGRAADWVNMLAGTVATPQRPHPATVPSESPARSRPGHPIGFQGRA